MVNPDGAGDSTEIRPVTCERRDCKRLKIDSRGRGYYRPGH